MVWWWKKNKERTLKRGAELLEELIECCDGKSNPIKLFSADEIRKATDNFSDSNYVNELANGDFNKWYSGTYKNHDMILIRKALTSYHNCSCRDIAVSSMVSSHKNFLKLVGCCLDYKDTIIVYNDVKKHYKLKLSEQPWKRRMKIAEDIATALAYLHTAFPRPFVYRALSLDFILLDEDGVAKLTEFSFCVSIPEGETFIHVESIAGTFSYMEFNYAMHGVVSVDTDVFAIGILMHKLLMGNKRYDELRVVENEESKQEGDDHDSSDSTTMSEINYPERQVSIWVPKFKEEQRMDEIADPEMRENVGEISEQELCQMKAFLKLSQRCVGLRGEVPTMVEVAKELKNIQGTLINDSSSHSDKT